MLCPSCSAVVPDGARFCPECGERMAAFRVEERRVVTVVFADIVGFTGLSEHRDPETVKRLIDRCMERLVAEIETFGGTVDKILGDGVLALFGAPVAHEDDAERAVRAALRMQEVISETTAPDGDPLQLRIGINTGEVLVGGLRARADYTAMGDVVNTAARLQALAPPGRILVGAPTYHQTVERIAYEAFGDVVARGREQTVPAWLAVAAIAQPGGRRHRIDLPIIGRDAEMALLQGGVKLAFARRRALLCLLEGEGGVGKSRLVAEIVSRVEAANGVSLLTGNCVPYGEHNVWWPLAGALLSESAQIDGPEESDHAEDRAIVALDPDAAAYLTGRSSSLDDLEPGRARAALGRAVIDSLQARLLAGPLVLTITDLNWADPALLALLEQIVHALAAQPFAMITTLRPDPDLRWPPAPGAFSTIRLRLDPLDKEAAGELLETFLGYEVDSDTVDRLYERSGGNALFLEELASLVAQTGATSELPDSLRGLIAARLDQLPPGPRAVLDNAAVLGGSGYVSALARFGNALGLGNTEDELQHLIDAGFLTVDNGRWRFRSESVREVAYQTLTKAARAQRHAGIALALSKMSGEVRAEDIAHHFAAAAELVAEIGPVERVPDDVTAQAVSWMIEATAAAVAQVYPRAAVRLATRALELSSLDPLAGPPSAVRRLVLLRAEAFTELRELARARADVEAALSGGADRVGVAERATAARLLGEIERYDGHQDLARAHLDESAALWRALDDQSSLALTLRTRGFIELFGGTPAESSPYLDEADEIYLRTGDRSGHAWIEQHRAWGSFLAGDVTEADDRLHRAAAVMEELGDRNGIGWAFGLLAFVRFYSGNREEAGQIAESVLRDAIERGDEWAAAMMLALQANLQLWEGRMAETVRLSESSTARMRRIGDGYGQIQALTPAVRALVALGRFAEARAAGEEIQAIAPRFGLEAFAAIAIAGAAVHAGVVERALQLSADALGADPDEGLIGSFDALGSRALAMLMAGRLDEALRCAEAMAAKQPDHPHACAVTALVAATDRRPHDAIAAARRIATLPGSTYFDRVLGGAAEAGAAAQLGDLGAARAALEPAWFTATATDDLVAYEIVRHLRRSLGVEVSFGDAAFPLLGWRTLLDGLLPADYLLG